MSLILGKKERKISGKIYFMVAFLGMASGFLFAVLSHGADANAGKKIRVIYPKETNLEFEGTQIEGELNRPSEFYFKHRPQEKFDSLVKRRKNFHREMLRDVVMTQ